MGKLCFLYLHYLPDMTLCREHIKRIDYWCIKMLLIYIFIKVHYTSLLSLIIHRDYYMSSRLKKMYSQITCNTSKILAIVAAFFYCWLAVRNTVLYLIVSYGEPISLPNYVQGKCTRLRGWGNATLQNFAGGIQRIIWQMEIVGLQK